MQSGPCSPGAALLLTGWHSLARVAANGGSPGAAALSLYLVGQGSVTSFLCSLAPNVGNFGASSQGKVHGLLLSGFGGSSALFASTYRAAYVEDLPAFFRLTGGITCGVALAGALLLKDGSGEGGGEGEGVEEKQLIAGSSTQNSSSTGGGGGGGGGGGSGAGGASSGGGGGGRFTTLEMGAVSPAAVAAGATPSSTAAAAAGDGGDAMGEGGAETATAARGAARKVGNGAGAGGCTDVCANFSDLFRRPLFWVVYFHLVITMVGGLYELYSV